MFTFSLGGSTEPPESPRDPPQKISLFAAQSSNLTTESGFILRGAKTIALRGRHVIWLSHASTRLLRVLGFPSTWLSEYLAFRVLGFSEYSASPSTRLLRVLGFSEYSASPSTRLLRVLGFPSTRLSEYLALRVVGFPSRVLGFPSTWLSEYLAFRVLGFPSTRLSEYLAFRVLGFPSTRLSEYSAFRECLAFPVLGFPSTWLSEYEAFREYLAFPILGSPSTWLFEYLAFRLLFHETFTRGHIHHSLTFYLQKKCRPSKKSSMAIHVATEAKWAKQIAGTMSYFMACKLVSSLWSHCFAKLSSLWAAKVRFFSLYCKLIIFWQFRKEDIARDRKMPKEFTP